MAKCEYCGSNITNKNTNCSKCGAPAFNFDGFERCECGLILPDKFMKYDIPRAICHKCFQFFHATFYAKYVRDIEYPNGQVTHLFVTKNNKCPHCGAVFKGHEFYHGIYTDKNIEDIAKETKRKMVP